MSDATGTGNGIMLRLRNETMQLHKATEQGRFQAELISGRLPLDRYADLLGQLLFVHRALESHLGDLVHTHVAFERVVRELQFQEGNLVRDLRHLGRDPEVSSILPETEKLIAEIERMAVEAPVSLLGVHYVFEGSKNGGRFIAKAVRKGYGLESGAGLTYL